MRTINHFSGLTWNGVNYLNKQKRIPGQLDLNAIRIGL